MIINIQTYNYNIKMINGNASNDFEFDTLTNPRLLRGKKEQLETPPSDLEVKIEEGR